MFIAGPQWMFRSSVTSAAFARPAIASSSAARYDSSLALSTIVTLSGVVASVKIGAGSRSSWSPRLGALVATVRDQNHVERQALQTSSSASTVLSIPTPRRPGAARRRSAAPGRRGELERLPDPLGEARWSPGTATNRFAHPRRPPESRKRPWSRPGRRPPSPRRSPLAAVHVPVLVDAGSAKTSASASAAATASWLSRPMKRTFPAPTLVGQGPQRILERPRTIERTSVSPGKQRAARIRSASPFFDESGERGDDPGGRSTRASISWAASGSRVACRVIEIFSSGFRGRSGRSGGTRRSRTPARRARRP